MSKVLSLTDKQVNYLKDVLENGDLHLAETPYGAALRLAVLAKVNVKGGPVKSEEVNPY